MVRLERLPARSVHNGAIRASPASVASGRRPLAWQRWLLALWDHAADPARRFKRGSSRPVCGQTTSCRSTAC